MKILGTDHYFHIGYAHLEAGKPCQDYAWSEMGGEKTFAIVSDGCSTGVHTDIGARIMTLATAAALRKYCCTAPRERFIEDVKIYRQKIISESMALLALPDQVMLATTLFAVFTPEGGVVQVDGDGVVAFKYQSGRVEMSRFEWDENTPFYPAYSEADVKRFVEAHGNDLEQERFRETRVTYTPKGSFSERAEYHYSLRQGMAGVTWFVPNIPYGDELEYVAIFTDGVTQVDGIDWNEAVVKFLSFKSVAGEFAKRRMQSGIKEARKTGKGPFDDIGYAVIRLDTEEPQGG